MSEYTEYGQIQPIIAGELTCKDQFGQKMTPRVIKFNSNGSASAVCYHYLYGTFLAPVHRSNGERLVYEGFSGLSCDYDSTKGVLENFRER